MKVFPTKVRGKPCWCLDYRIEGRRVRRFLPSRAKAEAELARLRLEADRAGGIWVAMSEQERQEVAAVLVQAREAGVSLLAVWQEWLAARKSILQVPLRDAIPHLIGHLEVMGRRRRYLAGLRAYLMLFARGREARPVGSIGVDEIREWFQGRGEAGATLRSNLGRLSSLFAHAVREGWAVSNPCGPLRGARVEAVDVSILPPGKAREALVWARERRPSFLAGLALMLLAGLRPEEVSRVTWEAVDLEAGTVVVGGRAAKTRRRRIVHLEPAARAWLALGGALPLSVTTRKRRLKELREVLGFEAWPQDILRHSAASYLLALKGDAGPVALELGNSPRILLEHYQGLATREAAAAFWAIRPE